jgi:hypothetical protein
VTSKLPEVPPPDKPRPPKIERLQVPQPIGEHERGDRQGTAQWRSLG